MEKAALYHCAESEYAYLYTANEIHIRFRSKKDDVDQVWLHYGDSTIFEDSGKYQYRVLMRKVATDDLHDYWLANVRVDYRRLLALLLKANHATNLPSCPALLRDRKSVV